MTIKQPTRYLKKSECKWQIKSFSEPGGPEYCGKKTNYAMEYDSDAGVKVRKYSHLCPKHQKQDKENEEGANQEGSDTDWDYEGGE